MTGNWAFLYLHSILIISNHVNTGEKRHGEAMISSQGANDRHSNSLLLRLIHSSLLFSFSITVLRFFAVHTLTHGIRVLIEWRRVARQRKRPLSIFHQSINQFQLTLRRGILQQTRSRGVSSSAYVVTAAAMRFGTHARAFLFVWHYLGVSR